MFKVVLTPGIACTSDEFPVIVILCGEVATRVAIVSLLSLKLKVPKHDSWKKREKLVFVYIPE